VAAPPPGPAPCPSPAPPITRATGTTVAPSASYGSPNTRRTVSASRAASIGLLAWVSASVISSSSGSGFHSCLGSTGCSGPGAPRSASGAGPHLQLRFEQLLVCRCAGGEQPFEEHLGSGRADLPAGLADRGQRPRGRGGEDDVVVADHGDLTGDVHAGVDQLGHDADRL